MCRARQGGYRVSAASDTVQSEIGTEVSLDEGSGSTSHRGEPVWQLA